MWKKLVCLLALWIGITCCPALLSGQTLPETTFSSAIGSGARALGMGGAFIAIADDATAASWNPGGLGQLEKPELTLVARSQRFHNALSSVSLVDAFYIGPKDFNGESYNIDFCAVSLPFRLGGFKIAPQLSYQRFISYSIETRANHIRYIGLISEDSLGDAVVDGFVDEWEDFRGGIDVVSLSLGFRLFDGLNIGFSLNRYFNGFRGGQSRRTSGKITITPDQGEKIGDVEALEDLNATFRGFNVNVGALLELAYNFKIGFVYKSAFNGETSFEYSSRILVDGGLYSETRNLPQSLTIEWPETWGGGVAYSPTDLLTISMDFTHTRWSQGRMRQLYDSDSKQYYDLYFPTMSLVNAPPEMAADNRPQVDSTQFRLGVEYVFIGKTTLTPLRFGYFSDEQFFPDAGGKSVVFHGLTGGVGYKKGRFGVDAALVYEFGGYIRGENDLAFTRYNELRLYVSTSYGF